MDATKYVPLAQKAIGFLSKRLSAVLALGAVFIIYGDKLNAMAMICLTVAVVAFIISQTYEDHLAMKQGKPSLNGGGEKGSAKLPALLVGLLLIGAMASAEILPLIDKLDLQAGPGLAVVDYKPFRVETVGIATAKIYERWGFQARLGGLLNTDHRALVTGLTYKLVLARTRVDGTTTKPLIPAIGLWVAGELLNTQEAEEDKGRVGFLWGCMGVMIEY